MEIKKLLVVDFCHVVVCYDSFASKINVESFASQSTESGWGAFVKGSGTLMSGNVDLLYLRSDLGVRYLTLHDGTGDENENAYFKDRFLLTGYYTRKEAGEAILDNEWYLHLRYTRMQWKNVGLDVYVQQQFDEFHRLISELFRYWRASRCL